MCPEPGRAQTYTTEALKSIHIKQHSAMIRGRLRLFACAAARSSESRIAPIGLFVLWMPLITNVRKWTRWGSWTSLWGSWTSPFTFGSHPRAVQETPSATISRQIRPGPVGVHSLALRSDGERQQLAPRLRFFCLMAVETQTLSVHRGNAKVLKIMVLIQRFRKRPYCGA